MEGKGNKMKKITLILAVVSIFLMAGCDEPKCKYSRTVDLNLPGAGGKTLVLKNNIGAITISGDSRTDGVGTATITGKGQTPEKAKEVAACKGIQILKKQMVQIKASSIKRAI